MQPSQSSQKFNSLVKTRYGYMIYNTHDVYIGQSLANYGEWSQEEVELLLELTKEDSVVLDLGANIGVMTVALATKAKHVLAVECQKYLYYMLCGNISLNSLLNVEPVWAAVGKDCRTINVPPLDQTIDNNFGGLSLMGLQGLPLPVSDGKDIPTSMITLDSLNLDRCDLIKMDIEGMELDVMEGAVKTIKKFKPIIYTEADRDKTKHDLFEFIINLGYEIWEHTPYLFSYFNFKNNMQILPGFNNVVSFNYLCLPKGGEPPVQYKLKPIKQS